MQQKEDREKMYVLKAPEKVQNKIQTFVSAVSRDQRADKHQGLLYNNSCR